MRQPHAGQELAHLQVLALLAASCAVSLPHAAVARLRHVYKTHFAVCALCVLESLAVLHAERQDCHLLARGMGSQL